jgi:hypothetical protein
MYIVRGCDPKKMLISGAEAIDAFRRMHGRGAEGELRIEWQDLMAFKRTFTDPVPRHQEENLARRGIDAFHGPARFFDSVTAAGEDLKARYILIASGARPAPLNLPGEDLLITSEQFLELGSRKSRAPHRRVSDVLRLAFHSPDSRDNATLYGPVGNGAYRFGSLFEGRRMPGPTRSVKSSRRVDTQQQQPVDGLVVELLWPVDHLGRLLQ